MGSHPTSDVAPASVLDGGHAVRERIDNREPSAGLDGIGTALNRSRRIRSIGRDRLERNPKAIAARGRNNILATVMNYAVGSQAR